MAIGFKILGTCAGTGVPSFFCDCPACAEAKQYPAYARTRTGAFMNTAKGSVLIDANPDIRIQLVRESIYGVDSIFLTHWHADHYSGLGEFEYYVKLLAKKPLDLYLPASAVPEFLSTFPDLIDVFNLITWEYNKKYLFEDVLITPLPANHGIETAGFLVESGASRLAYFPDTAGLPPETIKTLIGIDYFVCDATFHGENWYPDSHMTIEQAIKLGQQLNAHNTILTHLSMHYSQPVTTQKLKEEIASHPSVVAAWDGMCIELG